MSIYVGNLSYEIEENDLREVFGEYGTVNRVSIPTDRDSGRKRGFAFVEMSSPSEENAAIEKLDGAEWMGRDLKVNQARERQPRNNSGRGGYGGGRGDNRRSRY